MTEPKEKLDTKKWVTVEEAAELAGVSKAMIGELARDGVIERRHDGQKVRYSVEAIGALGASLGKRDFAVELLRTAMAHTEASFKMVHGPSLTVMELLQKENARLTERCAQLEASHTTMIQAREEALNEAHSRQMAERREAAKEARWDGVFKTLGQSAPLLMNQIGETALAWSKSRGGAAGAALRELDANIIAGILESETLSAEARAALQAELDARMAERGPRPVEPEPEAKPAPNGGVH